jgi:hypothetical protein
MRRSSGRRARQHPRGWWRNASAAWTGCMVDAALNGLSLQMCAPSRPLSRLPCPLSLPGFHDSPRSATARPVQLNPNICRHQREEHVEHVRLHKPPCPARAPACSCKSRSHYARQIANERRGQPRQQHARLRNSRWDGWVRVGCCEKDLGKWMDMTYGS